MPDDEDDDCCENCKWEFEDDAERRRAIVRKAKLKYDAAMAVTNVEANLVTAKAEAESTLLKAQVDREVRLAEIKYRAETEITRATQAWKKSTVWALFWLIMLSSIYVYRYVYGG